MIKRHEQCDTVIVGEETITALRSGEAVVLDSIILLPASDMKAADECSMSQVWQTMETAPKHYMPILACNPENGYRGIVFHNGFEWELLSYDGCHMGIGFYPTHWTFLPDIPQIVRQGSAT
ncbi:hypothetical protein EVC28_054 [Rhizobium phage RHph_I1_23]|nr:hypothetical protein EVC28_054 [Rhizobium phage RHph_I1_23]